MTNVIPFKPKPKAVPEQVAAAHQAVEKLREFMQCLGSDRARVEFCNVLIAQLCLWVIRSNFYDKPAEYLVSWVTRKANQYTKERMEG